MNSLPIETQLDVLKFLNSYQLTSVRQTNYHFSALIKRYESDLSMREFFRRIVIREFSKIPRKTKLIEYKPYVANFPPVDDQRLTKWQYVINQQIPLYLFTDRLDSLKDYVVYLVGCGGLKKKRLTKKSLDFVLRLPKYPNNIEEMQFVRFWLLQLFNCYFDTAMLDDHILFNPQLIKLLFENEANISLKFNINRIWAISFNYLSYKRKLEFIYDHLNVKHISLSFRNMNNIEEENSLLLEFFKTSGIFDLSIWVCNDIPTIYNSIINCIETSNDCSKMVSKIEFSDPNLIMEVQGEMINRGNYHGIVSCKYTNVYNPKIKFECKCYYPLKYHKDFKTRKGKIIRIEIERIKAN